MLTNSAITRTILGIGVGIGVATVALLFSDDKRSNHPHQSTVSQTLILNVLKELNREMIAPLVSLATTATHIRKEIGGSYSEETIRHMIASSSKI